MRNHRPGFKDEYKGDEDPPFTIKKQPASAGCFDLRYNTIVRIQLFDRGSPEGKKLFANIEIICQRLQIDYDPEYIQDMSRVYSMGIKGKTVILIDREVVLVDKFPSLFELEKIISDYLS